MRAPIAVYPAFKVRSGERFDLNISVSHLKVWRHMHRINAPASQQEISEDTGVYAAQARVSELQCAGMVELWDIDRDRFGKKVKLWVLTPQGRREIVKLTHNERP